MHSLAEEVSIWVARSDALRGLSGEHRSSHGKNQSRPKNDKNHSRGEDRKKARTAETGQDTDVDTGGRSSCGTKREGSAQEDPPARRHEGVPMPKRVREGDDGGDRERREGCDLDWIDTSEQGRRWRDIYDNVVNEIKREMHEEVGLREKRDMCEPEPSVLTNFHNELGVL